MATTAVERKVFVGGEWVETGDWLEVRSPYSGEVVGRVAKTGANETKRAIDAADEGSPRRGQARDVDLHLRRGRGAQARGRDGADGRGAGGRGQTRVHAAPPDRDRGCDQSIQLPAQPRGAQARARPRGRLRGRPQAGEPDPALGAAAGRARR